MIWRYFRSILWILYAVSRSPHFLFLGGSRARAILNLGYFTHLARRTGIVIEMFLSFSYEIEFIETARELYFWWTCRPLFCRSPRLCDGTDVRVLCILI